MKHAFPLLLAALLLALPAAAQANMPKDQAKVRIVDAGWNKRCLPDASGKEACEIVTNLSVEGAETRLAEFAVGYKDKENRSVAQGAVMLPLGILLEKGVVMRIDDDKAYKFKVHSCTENGCLSYVDLNTEILQNLRRGNNVAFTFHNAQGREIRLLLSLEGFTKALKAI